MASVKVELNKAGVGQLLKSAGVQAEMNRRASRSQAAAAAAAPVGKGRGGHLKDKIIVDNTQAPKRARARVVANTKYAGKIDTAWLARSLDSAKGR